MRGPFCAMGILGDPMRERGRALENIMKKKILSVLLCLALLITIAPKPKAHADAMTAAMIGQLALGMASSWGISFTAGNATGQGMGDYMTSQVESYVNQNGGSLTSLFGGEMARVTAGKLAVGQQLYEGVRNFVGWMKDTFSLSSEDFALTNGEYKGIFMPSEATKTETLSNGLQVKYGQPVNSRYGLGYKDAGVYIDGMKIAGFTSGTSTMFVGPAMLRYDNGIVVVDMPTIDANIGIRGIQSQNVATNYSAPNSLTWSVPDNWGEPQPLPQNKEWQGDFSDTPGFADPPQDLPDFLSRIPVGIAENNLEVTGEIVEAGTGGDLPTPSPSPSPSPGYNKGAIGLIIAEILSLINSLSGDTAVDPETIDQVAQEVAEQAQTVPDTITQTATQTQEAIQDATQTITETMTQTQTQTQTAIQDATQTITDSQTEIKDAIQDQTQEITDIKDAIQDATDVPTRDKWEQVKKDLHGVFPFCIPWDIYGMLTAFSAEPRAPHFEYPFKIPSIGLDYTLELDFADFDPVAQTLRTVELIAFSIGLAILTSKVIRW